MVGGGGIVVQVYIVVE